MSAAAWVLVALIALAALEIGASARERRKRLLREYTDHLGSTPQDGPR